MRSQTSLGILMGAALLLALQGAAIAHPGHPLGGFATGLAHPATGLDHLLALIGVGLWSSQLGGRLRWLLPTTFLTALVAGGALASVSGGGVSIEIALAASVLAIGLLVATARKMTLPSAVAWVALFAAFHGYAHVAEIPAAASPASYLFGLLTASALLLAAASCAGFILANERRRILARAAGIAIAACGAMLLLGVL